MKNKSLLICLFFAVIPLVTNLLCTSTSGSENGKVRPLRIAADRGYNETVRNVRFFVVKGVVQNNYTTNMCSINVSAIFYDADNEPTRIAKNSVALKIVKPQHKTPFEIYLPLHSSCPPQTYSLRAEGIQTDEHPIDSLEVVNQTGWADEEGFYRIVGEVENKGSMVAESVKVMCAFYDQSDNLITLSKDITSPISVSPGGKAVFKLSSKPFPSPDGNFELFIVVHHYEKSIVANWVLFTVLVVASLLSFLYMKQRGW